MRILVARSGGLGDCLITLPVLNALKHRYPDADIIVLGTAAMRAVAELAGYNRCDDLDDPRFVSMFTPGIETVSESLKEYFTGFDQVYLFTAHPEPNILIQRVTAAGTGFCRVLDPRPPAGFRGHIITHLMAILDQSDADHESMQPESIDPILVHLRTDTGDGILIHPGSGGNRKNWPLDRFLGLAEHVDEAVTFVIGPVECERGMEGELTHAGFPVITPETIGELAEMVASARVFIGNDSGAGHLAGMVGTPAVILYGPTNPRIWRPVGKKVRVIESRDGSLMGITVDDVLGVV